MMFSFVVFILTASFYTALGLNCGDLSGAWKNELGSTMLIKHDASSEYITGRYNTMVTSNPNAEITSSNITGWSVPMKDGALVSFLVFFNGGSSIAVWVGQCNVCEGKEYIFTTFVLRKYIEEPNKRWMSNVLNQNTFWRVTDGIEDLNLKTIETVEVLDSFELEKENSQIVGNWMADDGSSFQLSPISFERELQGNSEGQQLRGQYSLNDDFTGISFTSASMKKGTVKALTGYVHGKEIQNRQVLQTSWLEHVYTSNCNTPRNLVRFGIQNYTREHAYNLPTAKTETFLEKIKNFFKSLF